MRITRAARMGWLCAAVLTAGASLRALDMPNLSGKWFLDRDASDSPESAIRDPSGSGSGSVSRGDGGMGRGHGGRRGRSAVSDEGSRAGDAGSMQDALRRTQTLEIRHEEPRLSIIDASGRERILYTDGRKVEEERSSGGTTKVTARWKDGRVEVTSSPGKGPRVTETYAVTADHSQLTVTTTFQGGRRDVTIRRVYQATPPAAPNPGPAPPADRTPPAPEQDPGEDAVV
jgi:hypothetical protein